MKLASLLLELGSDIIFKNIINEDILNREISDIEIDSRKVANAKSDTVFFAYKGESFDSTTFAEEIENKNIIFIIADRKLNRDDINYAQVSDGRAMLSKIYSLFYNTPLKHYKRVGVTGTNGKTTSAYLIESIFKVNSKKSIRIGTTGISINSRQTELDNTTPGPRTFFKVLSEGRKEGCDHLVMEVSSHALAQKRLEGISFDVAIFTNLTGDHLDFHKDMESYFNAKAKLFTKELTKCAVINIDDEYGRRLLKKSEVKALTYSIEDKSADIYASEYAFDYSGIKAVITYKDECFEVRSSLIGEYNLHNILGAIGAGLALGFKVEEVIRGIEALNCVPGRLEGVNKGSIYSFVDYAHTDDALKNVLTSLNKIKKHNIIALFGAGGDRDKTKRPRMASVAVNYADKVVITSDNPRSEEPMNIINDILAGVGDKKNYEVIEDRESAIKHAVEIAESGDIILIAGKGHENYQIIKGVKHHFDDREIVRKYLENKEI